MKKKIVRGTIKAANGRRVVVEVRRKADVTTEEAVAVPLPKAAAKPHMGGMPPKVCVFWKQYAGRFA